MQVRLVGTPSELIVPIGVAILGRGSDCGLRVDDPRLSRHHARVHFDGDSLAIEDAGSTNGVLVNGDRIKGLTGLKNGDEVVCGPCLFTVSIDATIRSSPSELLPQPEAKAGRSTETMEPIDGGPDFSAGRKINPIIAAALTNNADGGSSNRLNPHELASGTTSALAARKTRKTVVSGSDAIEPNPPQAPSGEPPLPPPSRKDRTTGLVPADLKQVDQIALQAEYTDKSTISKAAVWRRAVAGILDSVHILLLMALCAAPLLILGYVLGVHRAGAIIDGGLPRLVDHPHQAAPMLDIAASLFTHGGLDCAYAVIGQLYHRDDQQAFLSLFACTTAALLAALLVVVLGLVSATVLRGGPLWHRKLGIEIVEHHTGYFPTWSRALIRWLCFGLLFPAVPIGLLFTRGLHDLCSGCRVRHSRR